MTEHVRNLLNAAIAAADTMDELQRVEFPNGYSDLDTTEIRTAIQDVLDDEQQPDESEEETHA